MILKNNNQFEKKSIQYVQSVSNLFIFEKYYKLTMTDFQLQTFATISGLGAASGIIYLNENIYLISDNSGFLYKYEISSKNLYKFPILENAKENIIKKDKPDFESITLNDNKFYIFGSGSTKKREIRVKFDLENNEASTKDVSDLYNKLKKKAEFTDDDLNIEGAFYQNENLYLFNRGNGDNSLNGIFIYNKEFENVIFKKFMLPVINNVETSFTDAIVLENKIYFLACAENTSNTYDDGEIYGSIIGIINIETLELIQTLQITHNQKFEGLTLYSKYENEINFLLCEDNDTEELVSNIYMLKINLLNKITTIN